MTTSEAVQLMNELGLKCTPKALQNYRKGYWTDRYGNQVWYFPESRLRLPADGHIGIGYTYSEEGVRTWTKMILKKREETYPQFGA